MKIVQRIGGRGFSGNRLEEFIKTIKKHPNSMNAVWLNTRYGYPSLDEHKEYANTLAQMAKALRAEGISVDLQLSFSFVSEMKPLVMFLLSYGSVFVQCGRGKWLHIFPPYIDRDR